MVRVAIMRSSAQPELRRLYVKKAGRPINVKTCLAVHAMH